MTGVVQEAARARPIVKAVGGKTQLLPELLARMPSSFGRYYEPFVGGGALFFRVAPERAVLADANADLIATYQAIADDVRAVSRNLSTHGALHGERHYNEVKAAWNRRGHEMESHAVRAAEFIYLNKAGFNGLYRVNRKGQFNVGYGKRATYEPDLEALRIAARELRRAELRAGDFRATTHDAQPGDFLFADPPYDETFTSYTAGKFSPVDQAEIAFTVRTLAARGVKVMASNADTPRIRALYAGMRIDVVKASRNVNCDGAGRGKVAEVIITAGYEPDEVAIARVVAERAAAEKAKAKAATKRRRAKAVRP